MARETLEIAEAVGHPQTVVSGLLNDRHLARPARRRGARHRAVRARPRFVPAPRRALWRPASRRPWATAGADRALRRGGESLLREAAGRRRPSCAWARSTPSWSCGSARRGSSWAQVGDAGKLGRRRAREHAREARGRARGLGASSGRRGGSRIASRSTLGSRRRSLPAGDAAGRAAGRAPADARAAISAWGSLYRRAGKDREARKHLETAAALFRDMGMRLVV